MPERKDVKTIVLNWEKYEYSDLENNILNDYQVFISVKSFSIYHLFYYQHQVEDKNNWDYKSYISKCLEQYDIKSADQVQFLLDIMNLSFRDIIYTEFTKAFFEALKLNGADSIVQGNSYIYSTYNKFMETGELNHCRIMSYKKLYIF